ncbi:MAG: methylenetetrahydrofolate--tRNA-(uracil(54)-C(5))-methyltransferase (FADH(2)-oxidizing) TrmFO [candidate division NC10 bacterium RIFCSPLOWO2_02_FULL_66_22]|nr:MAG: methylenetetrahydrofolate--tRNA-(uracil(54)-C(5))-methyltransferase (FADH(2)-oxidizing) TrmFO [candidate division NC10 bacterium RIFCSPLOWO2_02_FULL_66_22]
MGEPLVTIIGGGLAGCEAAWQAARRGCAVRLFEMRPMVRTPAHGTDRLAELVCSNSLKSESLEDASGLLKAEMRALGSVILECAEANRVPAGSALAVDREGFASAVTEAISGHPRIQVIREEVPELPAERPVIVATGPLTSDRLSSDLAQRFAASLGSPGTRPAGLGAALGTSSPTPSPEPPTPRWLYFYDAISPIVSADSIDYTITFAAARYGKGGADYLNCPMTRDEYLAFREALLKGERYPLHEFEEPKYFEGCLPVEELAERGEDTLRFGPMRPVGLTDPRTGKRPYAVVQLRQENRGPDGRPTMYNLVGFQTRLRRGDQLKALRLIPGLQTAEILRYGSVHRNTFITAPLLLCDTLQFRGDPAVFFAGQLTGVEGYLESAATGLLAGINAVRLTREQAPCSPPPTTMLGALLRYLTQAAPATFQPINANFGLLPPLARIVRDRRERNHLLAERALGDFHAWQQDLQ